MSDRYEIVQLLGQGAAGAVYLARDRLLGRREVALKRISARLDEALHRAFEREFSTMASLSVPGVAQVFDFGVMPDEQGEGRTFYTRAYIEGRPLDRATALLAAGGRVRLFARVARVIAPLHRVGVVHGDIKPGNAIIDARGDAHVIDFGLARVMGRERSQAQAGGTLPFMAPELLRGETPSVQSDVFALGATLWQLLSGSYPFGKRGLFDSDPAPALLRPAPGDAVTDAALEVAARALALDPRDRLPTVDELVAALEDAVPELRDDRARRLFVAPRPRGQLELLGQLQAPALAATRGAAAQSVLLCAPSGAGKSLLLRELKWRLQIRGTRVLEVAAADAEIASLAGSLARQLEVGSELEAQAAAALDRALAALNAGEGGESALLQALCDALAAPRERESIVLLVDDLDRAEAICGAALRSAVFADAPFPAYLVATATDATAAAACGLAADQSLTIPRLASDDLRALATEALGPIDASVLDALEAHSQGLPAALIGALAALFALPAATAADVRKLPPGDAGLALAHARLGRAPEGAKFVLELLAVLGSAVSEPWLCELIAELGHAGAGAELLAQCEAVSLIERRPLGVELKDVALEKGLLEALGPSAKRVLAERVLGARATRASPLIQRARLAVQARDADSMRELVPLAGAQLTAMRAYTAAAELYEALLEVGGGASASQTSIALARCRQALGELERAAELAERVIAEVAADSAQRVEAAIVSAQALTGLGRLDAAAAALSLVPADAGPDARALVQRELAKVHLRRVDYPASRAAAEAGLACVRDEVVRSELLCSLGMEAVYAADHERARAHLEEAVSLSRRTGAAREEATALATLAMSHFRTGEWLAARDLFAQCLEIARRLGDVGSMANYAQNLGVILFCLGEPAAAAEHYESAARLAKRAGRLSSSAQARNNLAHLHIYFGLYERAKGEVNAVLEHARAAQQKYIQAQATALLGDLAARGGDVEQALIHYGDAIARYAELGQTREIADHNLDAAEALLDRGGPADFSAAAARLAAAREHIEREGLTDLSLRLALLLSRTRLASGEGEGALTGLEAVIERARKERNRELEWNALSAAAQAHEALGSELTSRRFARMAVEVLEEIALRVPREHRDAFWRDPRRRAARDRALTANEPSQRSAASSSESSTDLAGLMTDTRAALLLDIIKRLASEQDLDRLLERITEGAVDLSGAERGYVLLVDKQGALEKRTMQTARSEQVDPHAAFSRSIAEAVLIDGEPIVTMDATSDGRLSEYVSVHKLMLRSVACLPIRGRSGTVGVLYLEHRRSRGRFSEAAVSLLHAFADQAAIALENARLNAENAHRHEELAAANRALEHAKQELEELLSARTEALLDAQRELTQARRVVRSKATRHGMVGRTPAMLRIFDTIDRVHSARVPVIIHGESGTGKELVARAVHEAGVRAKAPFVAINCGSVPESLLESELFGHVEGAFSGAERERRGMIARASGGTLFLDEVGDMPARMQVDLLRVLQEGTVCPVGSDVEERVDVRFIAASNRCLSDLVQEGRFREDLYYRLNVVEIALPPLRERREDIPLLCQHFLQAFAERDRLPEKRLTRDALELLLSHPLPGNVRQLEHLLLQAWVLVQGPSIDATDLALDSRTDPSPSNPPIGAPAIESLGDYREAERRKILAALDAHGWNRARAARALGMPRRTFYRRLQDHSIL